MCRCRRGAESNRVVHAAQRKPRLARMAHARATRGSLRERDWRGHGIEEDHRLGWARRSRAPAALARLGVQFRTVQSYLILLVDEAQQQ